MATATTTLIPTGTWAVDPTHSTVEFQVKHMGIANVKGKFNEFAGTLEIGDNLATAKASGTVKVASVDTNEEQRDAHLRSAGLLRRRDPPRAVTSPRPRSSPSTRRPSASPAT